MAKILQAVILGAPASGKGTISSRIVKSFDLIHISSGDILRGNDYTTANGVKVKTLMEKGLLVPDNVIMALIEKELNRHRHKSWILDGFPRTRTQAEMLSIRAKMDFVINLVVDYGILINRIKGRWVHLSSGRVYHNEFNPPIVPNGRLVFENLRLSVDHILEEHQINIYYSIGNKNINIYLQYSNKFDLAVDL